MAAILVVTVLTAFTGCSCAVTVGDHIGVRVGVAVCRLSTSGWRGAGRRLDCRHEILDIEEVAHGERLLIKIALQLLAGCAQDQRLRLEERLGGRRVAARGVPK